MSGAGHTQFKNLSCQLKRLGRSIEQGIEEAKQLVVTRPANGSEDDLAGQCGQESASVKSLVERYDVILEKASELENPDPTDDEMEEILGDFMDISISGLSWASRVEAYGKHLTLGLAMPRNSGSGINGSQSNGSNGQHTRIDGVQQGAVGSYRNIKLPKLELRKFNGDILKWKEFWDSYDVSVHMNNRLQSVEKFNYLVGLLEGEARASIAGLDITNQNYMVAVSLLKERFGNTNTMITAMHARLMAIEIPKSDVQSLRRFYNDLECVLRSLVAVGQAVDNQHFVAIITGKLPKDVLLAIEMTKRPTSDWSTDLLRAQLNAEIMTREAVERLQPGSSNGGFKGRNKMGQLGQKERKWGHSTGEALVANERSNKPKMGCVFCGKDNHWSDQCKKFKTVKSRKEQLKDRCYKCLSNKHKSGECKVDRDCPYCQKSNSHHRSLCYKQFPDTGKTENATVAADSEKGDKMESEGAMLASTEKVLLQTATTMGRKNKHEKGVEIKTLLDCASNRSYITEKLAKQLKLDLTLGDVIHISRFASDQSKTVETKSCQMELVLVDRSTMKIWVNVVPQITGTISRASIDLKGIEFLLKGIKLADRFPVAEQSDHIELLIGNDYYLDIITGERIVLRDGLHLWGSKLGWIITGRTECSDEGPRNEGVLLAIGEALDSKEDTMSLDEDRISLKTPDMEKFWELETIGIKDTAVASKEDEDRIKRKFEETVEYENGRYMVQWPRKEGLNKELPDNFGLAYRSLKSLVRKLDKFSGLQGKCNDITQDQLKKGVIEKVADNTESVPGKVHYIPHHVVITPQKLTTKLRVVYNASAKTSKDNLSLNECLYKGHNYLKDICGLLIRFRMPNIAMSSDIEKAFLLVGLQEQERDVVRFLWLEDPEKLKVENNLQIYRFSRVPFGVVSSPYLLGATIDYHLSKSGSRLAKEIMCNIYMDNIFLGSDCEETCPKVYHQAKQVFKDAGMNLRSWSSNCQDFIGKLPQVDQDTSTPKVLGIGWDSIKDTLQISNPKFGEDYGKTKRDVLHTVALVFDPLGWFQPITILGRLFLQELWVEQWSWEDQIPESKLKKWKEIVEEMKKIPSISLDRFWGKQMNMN